MHDHKHSHSGHSHNHSHTDNIKMAFFLNLAFSLIEFVGGIYTNSIAILSDALHDLGDSFSLLLAWYFQKVSTKKRDAKYSYGYKRFSLLGALINSAVLLVGSVFIIIESVKRFTEPQQPMASGMLVLAIIGVFVNALAMLRLRKGSSINEHTVSLHMLEDMLGWIAVLVGSIIMMFFDIPILDPILSVAIAAFILFNIYKNLSATFNVILQGIPDEVDEAEVLAILNAQPHVIDVHDLHIWSMDGEYNILTAHIVTDASIQSIEQIEELKSTLKAELKTLHIDHPTLEMEMEGVECAGCS